MSENKSIDDRIKEAQELINIHHDYEKAEKIFLSVVKEDPEDDRGWYGLLRACTCRFDAVEYLIEKRCQKIPEKFNSYYAKACETANAKNREIIKKRWAFFIADYKELYELCIKKKNKRKEDLSNLGVSEEEKKTNTIKSGNDDGVIFFFIILAVAVILYYLYVNPK